MKRFMAVLSISLLAGCASHGATQGPPATAPAAPTSAVAPAPPLTPAQRAARSVASLEIRPADVSLKVGEVIKVEILALDASGQAVSGVQLRRFLQGAAATYKARRGEVTARAPGDATLIAMIRRPRADGSGMEMVRAEARIHVVPPPVVRVEVKAPERPLYAGTRGRAEAIAFSTEGQRDEAKVEWSSSKPRVLRVGSIGLLQAGRPGTATLTATSEGVSGQAVVHVVPNPVRALSVQPEETELRVGDVTHFSAVATDHGGRSVEGAVVEWSVAGLSEALEAPAHIEDDGTFVANEPGEYRVTATIGSLSTVAVVVATPRPPRRAVKLIAHGDVSKNHSTSDLWVFQGRDGRDYAYTGTHAAGAGGNVMFAWDVTDPATPVITDSVVVEARVVNDVKINADATLAVITREGAASRKNGIVILDIADPAHPAILSRFTENLTAGIHNAWIEGDYVYVINDGTRDVHIIDISDPANPKQAGRWGLKREGRYLHDIMIKDGLAYLSYWNDGLVILDVGAGIKGGTPTEPKFVSQYKYRSHWGSETFGNTHHAIRYKNYVFLGDEIFGCKECVNGPRGYVHVVDVTDIEKPHEVARFRVPEAGTHNLWAEDDKLYVAYYEGGVRIVDISGELRGDLYRQGRELGWYMTEDDKGFAPHETMTWGPQPYKGLIYATDINSGLWIVKLEPAKLRS